MDYLCNSIKETHQLASRIANDISVGAIIALIGDLGSGKTTFTQGFAKSLGINENVGSPTFKLISEYDGKKFKLYHIDAYRLKDSTDFLNIGGEGYLIPDEGVTIIEWADNIRDLLPEDTIHINFDRIQEHSCLRKIRIVGMGSGF